MGCEDCIVIWYLTAGAMKPGKDRTAILKNDGHSPINSVEYSSDVRKHVYTDIFIAGTLRLLWYLYP